MTFDNRKPACTRKKCDGREFTTANRREETCAKQPGRALLEIHGGALQVPAGYDFMLNLIGLHRHPDAYESPETFDPHRCGLHTTHS